MSHVMSPSTVPTHAPPIMALPVRRPQKMQSEIGITADPITTPMNKYTQPKLIWKQRQPTVPHIKVSLLL